jgi:hypothetical protein
VTVYRGEVVRWTNSSATRFHTTTSSAGLWDSGVLAPGQGFAFAFDAAGDYDYYCAIHPRMTGRITVLETGVTATPTLTETPTATATPTDTPTATATATATPTASGPLMLLGEQSLQSNLDYNPAGMAEAFQYTATASGTVDRLYVYVDGSSTATKVVLGLYADGADGEPGALLAQATITAPLKGAWNAVAVPPTSVAAGSNYWIAVLGPSGSGTVRFRDLSSGGGRALTSMATNLTTLPATWSTGSTYDNSPMSAYASQNR